MVPECSICVILATASIFLVKTLMCQCEMNYDNGLTCWQKMVSSISVTWSMPIFDKMTTFRTWELGQNVDFGMSRTKQEISNFRKDGNFMIF